MAQNDGSQSQVEQSSSEEKRQQTLVDQPPESEQVQPDDSQNDDSSKTETGDSEEDQTAQHRAGENDQSSQQPQSPPDKSPSQPTPPHDTGPGPVDFGKLGLVVYGVIGTALFIGKAFQFLLADNESVVWMASGDFGLFIDDELFAASIAAFDTFLLLAPIVGVVLAVYYHTTDEIQEMPGKPAAVAATVGVVCIGLLLIVFMIIFEPDAAEIEFTNEITPLIGTTLGTIIIAGGIGYLIDENPLDIF